MKIKLPICTVLMIVLGLLGTFYAIGRYSVHQKYDRAISTLESALNDTISHYQITLRGLEQQVYEKQQLILTEREAKELALVEKERYRKLHLRDIQTVTSLEGQISMLIDSLNHTPSVVYITVKDSVSKPFLSLPFKFWKKNQYLNLDGAIDTTANVSLALKVPVSLDLTIGVKRKNQQSTSIVTTANPHLDITGINSVKIVREEHFWEKGWFHAVVGVAVGGTVVGLIK